MKRRLTRWLRCPDCRAEFELDPQAMEGEEVIGGLLSCRQGHRFDISDGIPRLHLSGQSASDHTQQRTAASFGYLWASADGVRDGYGAAALHHTLMDRRLALDPPAGLVLDAGCGDGLDVVAHAARAGVEAIGVEISDGGSRAAFARSMASPRAHIVQADLRRLPFAADLFDAVYSYGVLHHLAEPEQGLHEIVRVAKPNAPVAAYLYEDFADRSFVWRTMFALANTTRRVTTRLPHRVLYGLCRAAAPGVYVGFTLPARIGRHIGPLRGIAERVPFRHGASPSALVGDLFDRLSAPVEWRYGREGALRLFRGAGLGGLRIEQERGWMLVGRKTAADPVPS